MNRTFLILGGCGQTGSLIAQLLLEETDVQVVLADIAVERAQSLAMTLNREYNADRVSAMALDAADTGRLESAFDQVDFVLVASSTADYVKNVAAAAMSAKIDYLDIQYSTAKVNTLKSMKEEIEQSGCCFVTEGGLHPGLPATLVRYAACHLEDVETANVGSLVRINLREKSFSVSTARGRVKEIRDFQPIIFKNGRWMKASWRNRKKFHFGSQFGEQNAAPMLLEEMRPLPEMVPSLHESGFYVGGFHWCVDYVIMPVIAVALSISSERALNPSAKLLSWGLATLSNPPYGSVLVLEASGRRDGKNTAMRVRLHHQDGYAFTAISVMACLLQYLDGSARRPGLWLQANLVEPDRMLHDMGRLGVSVETDYH